MAERGRPRGFDRTQALEAAMQVFWAKTYEGASMTDLTEAMGIGSPSLYAAFGSKESLFREALAYFTATRGGEMWRALEAGGSAKASIAAFLDQTVEAYSQQGHPPGCLVVLGAQHGWCTDDPIQRDLAEMRRRNRHTLSNRFARGIVEGDLAKDFDVHGAAAFYLSVQTGMAILARDGAGRDALVATARGGMAAWDSFAPGA